MALFIGACDPDIIAWAAVGGAGICGSDVSDRTLDAVDKRIGSVPAPQPVEDLSDDGSAYTRQREAQLHGCLEPRGLLRARKRPQSTGMSEAFVKILKRVYLSISRLPDAPLALQQVAG